MERLRLPATLPSLARFREFVDRWAQAAGAGPELLLKIELVLEELLVNQVLHAYAAGDGESEVNCFCRDAGHFCMEVVDEAAPFDPLEHASPDVTLAAADRPIGGLGIHMVRSLADELSYRREAGKNVMTVCFRIAREHDAG